MWQLWNCGAPAEHQRRPSCYMAQYLIMSKARVLDGLHCLWAFKWSVLLMQNFSSSVLFEKLCTNPWSGRRVLAVGSQGTGRLVAAWDSKPREVGRWGQLLHCLIVVCMAGGSCWASRGLFPAPQRASTVFFSYRTLGESVHSWHSSSTMILFWYKGFSSENNGLLWVLIK